MVIGIKDRDTNKVSVEVLPEATKARMAHFIDEHKANNAKICTDENPTYKGMNGHESVKPFCGPVRARHGAHQRAGVFLVNA